MERVQTVRARRHRHRLLLAPAARLAFSLLLHASVCDSASMEDGDLPIYNGYRVLRQGGVDDIDDHFGQGKLHQSAVLGYTALLNQGANPDLLTKRGSVIAQTRHGAAEGNTALIIAAAEGFADICELLIQAGARIDHRS